ncbi:MAG: 5'-nucleotidase C-terminal domain-containing protein [Bacteroidaceae bacterium]|nr:5'-nucleotidase C-terminal domain-containing protein [Bacteroidaceae bacterium]
MDTLQRKIKIIFTTDIHGNYFPYDFRHDRWGKGSLQRVHGFVAQQCRYNPVGTILIDGGDILQGEPTSYYFNFVAQRKHHRVADFCNFIGYDACVMGNHDIETGHAVFDDFTSHCNFPVLGANAISKETGLPYFEPYTILRRSGLKIAVLGFITAAIPQWVPRNIWSDLRFEGIRESAAKWIQRLKETEQPDYIIGVFHSGMDDGIVTPEYKENEVRDTAESVDGFDLILYGHDHASRMEEIDSPSGQSVLCINPGSNAYSVAEIDVRFTLSPTGRVLHKDRNAQLRYIGTLHNSHTAEFNRFFNQDFKEVKAYAEEKIGIFTDRVDVRDAYFGSSAYIDLIQELQLYISGAEISFSAPLFFHASIEAGDVRVSNLFDLYRFEDHLFTLDMTGQEIKNYLEMSYANWTNQMLTPTDTMLQIAPMRGNPDRMGFVNFIFNFDSAAGIQYEVDVTKPTGQKVRILQTDTGQPFLLDKTYRVAMTAYRANGGGELLTKGAGLSKEEIARRVHSVSKHDIRYYLLQYVKAKGIITPQPRGHWRFVPTEWTQPAIERERSLLFDRRKPFPANTKKADTETEKQ